MPALFDKPNSRGIFIVNWERNRALSMASGSCARSWVAEEDAVFDNWEAMLAVFIAILIAYGVVLWIGTVFWTYRDITSRTQDGWTQAVSVALVLVFNILGLLLYLVVRPQETLNEAYERRMEAEALIRDMPPPPPSCPTCRQLVKDDFLVCPNCKTTLREACEECERPLELAWAACPYCAAPGPNGKATTIRAAAPAMPPAPEATQPPPRPQPSPATQTGRPPTTA